MKPRSTYKYFHGTIDYNGKEYHFMIPHPRYVLTDKNISWEAKGYLSHFIFIYDDIDWPEYIIDQLIKSEYLVEVAQ